MQTYKWQQDPEDTSTSPVCKQKRIKAYFLTKDMVAFSIPIANQYALLADTPIQEENQNGVTMEEEVILQEGGKEESCNGLKELLLLSAKTVELIFTIL